MKYIIAILFWLSISQSAYSQNVTLQCPPCRPFSSCGQCWTSEQEAIIDGCGRTAFEKRLTEPQIDVVPNPSDGSFSIQSENVLEGEALIVNQYGTPVKRYTLSNKSFKVESLDLPSGIYYLIYTDPKTGRQTTRRIIIH